MSIAQRLCNEIVEPAIKPAILSTSRKCMFQNPKTSSSGHRSSNTRPINPQKSINVQKRKTSSKLPTRESFGSGNFLRSSKLKNLIDTAVNTFVSGPQACDSRTLLQSKLKNIESESHIKPKYILIDTAVNTLVSGPITCENHCVTNLRKRKSSPANRCACKCSLGKLNNCKASVKEIQTHHNRNYFLADKACSKIVEKASCGTQFLETLSKAIRQRRDKPKSSCKETMTVLSTRRSQGTKVRQESQHNHKKSQAANSNCSFKLSSKRWALNHFPVQGPDF
ncbi:uncharacterized protein LOC124640620 [Helicoverpa zea]|uniref:uncharacterized protein LOC124640620 n=1 Tax=Helicoverpa zea TaxID=7113 RepID=UPI001F57DA91|nr:uncharacterized protein LOC124640620 [Helicoverpa zea]